MNTVYANNYEEFELMVAQNTANQLYKTGQSRVIVCMENIVSVTDTNDFKFGNSDFIIYK